MATRRNSKGRFQKPGASAPKQLWAFTYGEASRLRIKIVDSHPDFVELVEAVEGRYIKFREGRYATNSKYVARYLRELIKANAIRGLREDISMYPIKCTIADCDFSLPDGGDANKQKMMDHLYAEHMDDPAFGGEDEAALTGEEDDD